MLHGDVILRSAGDPSLDPIFMTDPNDPIELLSEWVHALSEKGVVYIHGNLIVDASAFGDEQDVYPEAWDPSHRTYSYATPPSAIAIRQNLLRVTLRPGEEDGPGRLSFSPTVDGMEIVNKTSTDYNRRRSSAIATFNEDGSSLEVSGHIRPGAREQIALAPLPRPLASIGRIVRALIEKEGLRLTGDVVIRTNGGGLDASVPMAERLGWHESPTLAVLMRTMMLRSNNFLAEQIWRAAGVRAVGRGDVATVRRIEQNLYGRWGLPWIEPGYDGSGLSRRNRHSASELVALMRVLYRSPHREYLLDTLPLSGHSGTLRHRTFSRRGGRVKAKTGSLAGASALTGFIHDREGKTRWAFSVIGNAPGDTDGRLTMRINELLRIVVGNLDDRPL